MSRFVLILGLISIAFPAQVSAGESSADWAGDFASPSDDVAPHTWWMWMNGNVTKEGITADLEAMQRVGIRSATIYSVGTQIPAGPVKFLSPEWLEMVKWSAQEGKRLGVKVGMSTTAAWDSGGPWIDPAHSMLEVTSSEKQITGPAHFSDTLPAPKSRLGFYREMRVVAFPAPAGEGMTMDSASPTIAGSAPGFDASKLNHGGAAILPLPKPGQPQYVQFAFDKPFEVRSLFIDTERNTSGSCDFAASDDGENFHTVRSFTTSRPNDAYGGDTIALPDTTARFYRLIYNRASNDKGHLAITALVLSPGARIDHYRIKMQSAGVQMKGFPFDDPVSLPVSDDAVVHPDKMIDLTDRFHDGKLNWDVPAGNWTVLRFGYTTTGSMNHAGPPEGTGLECNKLSREGAKWCWNGIVPKVAKELGPLMGTEFTHVLIDSYEVGEQNWTPDFREEFRKRRGYDLTPYLPALTGRVVESPEKTERFLWDFRRTIADLFTENYGDAFAELAHQAGLQFYLEPYGGCPSDDLEYGRSADPVMGEFWWGYHGMPTVKLAASIAHIYGKKVVAAESFSSHYVGGQASPPTMKALGDEAFCNGCNAFTFHRFAMQPWLNRWPGMTYAGWGSNIERTATWWEQGTAWMQYISRCQYLLRKGLFGADVLVFAGEGAPRTSPDPEYPGYGWDACDADVIMNRLLVKEGRLVLPDGMSYRLLLLNDTKRMTPVFLRKLKELADEGATILGPKPEASPGLTDYPQCDAEVKKLADELWGGGKIKPLDGTVEEALASMGVKPDFQPPAGVPLMDIHRIAGDTDIYFVSNQRETNVEGDCLFRVSGKVPELWHADTGTIEKIANYEEKDGLTRVPLHLEPVGSVFVVFRAGEARDHAIAVTQAGGSAAQVDFADGTLRLEAWQPGTYQVQTASGKTLSADASSLPAPLEVTGPWEIDFPPNWGAPQKANFEQLMSWSDAPDPGVKYFSGTATYHKTMQIPARMVGPGRRLYLELGDVEVIAQVKLNGKDLGILWKPPYRADITDAAQAGDNALEVKVTNLWTNRMIGDSQLPEDCNWNDAEGSLRGMPQWVIDGKPSPTGRFTFATWRTYTKDSPLVLSGLIGPVMLQPSMEIELH